MSWLALIPGNVPPPRPQPKKAKKRKRKRTSQGRKLMTFRLIGDPKPLTVKELVEDPRNVHNVSNRRLRTRLARGLRDPEAVFAQPQHYTFQPSLTLQLIDHPPCTIGYLVKSEHNKLNLGRGIIYSRYKLGARTLEELLREPLPHHNGPGKYLPKSTLYRRLARLRTAVLELRAALAHYATDERADGHIAIEVLAKIPRPQEIENEQLPD